MTADERIEKLLNRFGQTIEDLPKPAKEGEGYAYEFEHRNSALEAALCWTKANSSNPFFKIIDYICHLADVIDRLEIALETAFNQLEEKCGKCSTYDCHGNCRDFFRLRDELLIDPELEIDDAD